ncbi:mitochondrial intermembrane space import and assembly protein 40 [Diplodia corticola]|uniref:Mitochondrial intermembrane space import and assembly protein 40 n=1 Tax=Diplodia corticola TaxID=236234 RepID=A0A1J9QTE5_9PEZI|nr:mitochondrial intermembrane space import and assembly protein 40 [Diplodia corticola]OJD32246.1 mitochondrial intermembrane space import and assembly protein 40 [Diplodia corticola]
MFRPATRAAMRAASSSSISSIRAPAQRRLVSTAPPTHRSRSWKNSAARWGLVAAGIYYYNTSNAFADEPDTFVTPHAAAAAVSAAVDNEDLPTLESVAAERRKRLEAEAARKAQAKAAAASQADASSPEQLEAEADQQGAFNPETGEINWDCPCLGGMAHGPCGEQFKAAFSCFVYSKEEPKGMDCIDKFKGMQDCFRQYPDIYGEELEGDDEDGPAAEGVDAAVAQDLAETAVPAVEAPKPATES